jgi:hypothetical protein
MHRLYVTISCHFREEKPILFGMGFTGDSGFLILRIETDCNAAKFTEMAITGSVDCEAYLPSLHQGQ